MKELLHNIQTLVAKHKMKLLAAIVLLFILSNYQEIKEGFIEGYNGAMRK
jgi:hypothetical protein